MLLRASVNKNKLTNKTNKAYNKSYYEKNKDEVKKARRKILGRPE